MAGSKKISAEEVVTHSSGDTSKPPDLRLLHYNDVYHVDSASAEPVGGIARFQTVCKHYRQNEKFKAQPELITFFSGDAFNPSLESSVTKGSHMVPILNNIGTNVACVGNHDLDFGMRQYRHLTKQCTFPWLLANVLDPALGEDVPLGNAQKTVMLTSSNGIKIGVIGLVEREWLDTINSLPPDLIYKSASATAKELVPRLRKDGAEIIVAVSHQREPNDNKLAEKIPEGLIDIVLGGHDHYYKHSIINGVHVLRSGSDFKQLSYIEARRKSDNSKKWDLHIIRRDIVSSIAQDQETVELTSKLTAALKSKLDKPIGHTLAPLDARFVTVRMKESNMGNFICDLMRTHYNGDCCIMASGTIRGDQIYPPGVLRVRDIMNCFPFEDPCIVIRITGKGIHAALENSVSNYPALEGRFAQVSNIEFAFDPRLPAGSRIPDPTANIKIGGAPLDLDRKYVVVTRGYMGRGKDGFDSLLVESEGGEAEEIVSEENGILISMMLRQYFMSLKIMGQWSKWGRSMDRHWKGIHRALHERHPVVEPKPSPAPSPVDTRAKAALLAMTQSKPAEEKQFVDDSDDEEHTVESPRDRMSAADQERTLQLMRRVTKKWRRLAGLQEQRVKSCDGIDVNEFQVDWTRAIAPRLERRIVNLAEAEVGA